MKDIKIKTSRSDLNSRITADILSGKMIGIAGFGHLGSSIVCALIEHGFPKDRMLISCSGRAGTVSRICDAGLAGCLTDTAELMRRADIILLAARPQSLGDFAGLSVKDGAVILSFMAGVSLETLGEIFPCHVSRIMCSGPDTIEEGFGIGTSFPSNHTADAVLRACGLKILAVSSECEVDAFTVSICLPAILLNINVRESDKRMAFESLSRNFPVCGKIAPWIDAAVSARSGGGRKESLAGVATKGGVTEAMTTALGRGTSFYDAVAAGLKRNDELRAAMREALFSVCTRS